MLARALQILYDSLTVAVSAMKLHSCAGGFVHQTGADECLAAAVTEETAGLIEHPKTDC